MSSDSEDIESVVRDIANEQHFRERNLEWDASRRLVFMERAVTFAGINQIDIQWRTPELLDAADKYAARFLSAPITINVAAQAPGPRAEEKAQEMENYDYRLVSRWIAGGMFDGPIHDMVGVTGEGWVHLTLNRAVLPIVPQRDDGDDDEAYLKRAKDILDEFSEGERADLFVLEPIKEPETIYYTPSRDLIFTRAKVPLAPLCSQYGKKGAGGLYGERGKAKKITKEHGQFTVVSLDGAVRDEGSNASLYDDTVMLYIVETNDYIYHIIEDDVASQGRTNGRYGAKYNKLHSIGCYKNVFGAPGFVSVHGRKTNHPSSQFAVHPLTYAAIKAAPAANILGTICLTGGVVAEDMRQTLEPLPGAEAAAERANNKNLEVEIVGERFVKPPDGWKIVKSDIGLNADTWNAFTVIDAKMAQYGYPPALGQPEQVDATSGYQQSVMRDTVSSVLNPLAANFAAMIGQILRLKDTGVKTLGVPITFRNFSPTDEMGKVARSVMESVTIDPDDIVDVDRSVTFDSLTQYARQAKIEQGMILYEKGIITEDKLMRDYMGVDDPLRLKRQRLMEQAEKIAEAAAIKVAAGLFQRVQADVEGEALADTGLMQFMAPEPSMALGAEQTRPELARVQPPVPEESSLGQSTNGATARV